VHPLEKVIKQISATVTVCHFCLVGEKRGDLLPKAIPQSPMIMI